MDSSSRTRRLVPVLVAIGALAGPGFGSAEIASVTVVPAQMTQIGSVSERFQSYNVEMLEVTGGKFWKPYKEIGKSASQPAAKAASQAESGDTPTGMSADLYQYRRPIDLTNRRLRAMARALGPAYMRISGTWANTTYFDDTDTPSITPPQGYGGVLTRQQWRAAIDFSRAVDAPIVTSMPLGTGTRGADGIWRPDQARRWLAFTKANGGTVAAAEFFNEPTLASMGGAPKGYNAAAFGQDFRVFDAFMRKEFAETKLLAPGSVGEANADWAVAAGGYGSIEVLPASELASFTGDADAFSYHHYGAASERCVAMGHQTSSEQALSEEWLGRTDQTLAYYRAVRDRAMPGKHFWNTETADAACGGNPWAVTFLDTFRYLDQLGRLARQEVDVVLHNTLVASDYGLLDENTFAPKPNYWGALLWRKLMGTTVLDSGIPIATGNHVYAHCLRGVPSGVALLVINNNRTQSRVISVPTPAMRYTLRAAKSQDTRVALNGKVLELGENDALPALTGTQVPAGNVSFEPMSITFMALPAASNNACR